MTEQIQTENVVVAAITENKTTAVKNEGRKDNRRNRNRNLRRKSDDSESKPKEGGERKQLTRNSTSNEFLIGRRPGPEYIYILKKIFMAGTHDEMQLNGVSPYGNSKVIWVANRLVHWGYVSITKIKTQEPNQL